VKSRSEIQCYGSAALKKHHAHTCSMHTTYSGFSVVHEIQCRPVGGALEVDLQTHPRAFELGHSGGGVSVADVRLHVHHVRGFVERAVGDEGGPVGGSGGGGGYVHL